MARPVLFRGPVMLCMLLMFSIGTIWKRDAEELFGCSSSSMIPPTAVPALESFATGSSASSTMENENDVHDYILGPDEYENGGCGANNVPQCGCPKSRKDCPQWYSLQAIQKSAAISNPTILARHAKQLEAAKTKAEAICDAQRNKGVQTTGGWCLKPQGKGKVEFTAEGISYPMSMHHVPPSKRIVSELVHLIQTEHVTSLNDFGAGIAQYKAAVTAQVSSSSSQASDFTYRAYDGAGNGRQYTKGMLEYFDLTLPLDLPVADWVLSLEVGEHVPSKYEGMLIRNLHRHNRRGIILSWGVLGQFGHSHVNNHSNEYLIRVFEGLGYTYDEDLSKKMRDPTDNYQWFENSVMVFRRKNVISN